MDEKYNDDWKDELRLDYPEINERLAMGKNKRSDLKVLAKLMYKYNSDKSKENVLDRVITWVSDWNNQVSLIPDDNEYKRLLNAM